MRDYAQYFTSIFLPYPFDTSTISFTLFWHPYTLLAIAALRTGAHLSDLEQRLCMWEWKPLGPSVYSDSETISIFCTISFRRLCCFSTRLDISLILQEITAPLYLHGFFKCTVEWVSVVLKQKGKVWNSTCASVWPVPDLEELIDGRSGQSGSWRWSSLSVWKEHVGYRMLICFKHTVFFISQSSLSLMSLILLVFFSAFFHCCPLFYDLEL